MSQPTTESGISSLLTERIAAGDFPSAVYLIGESGDPVFAHALGNAEPRMTLSIPLALTCLLSHSAISTDGTDDLGQCVIGVILA